MESLNITYSYVSLEKAGALLKVSASDLIHAGAFNQVQICVNIYARATGLQMQRIDDAIVGDYSDIDTESIEEAQAHDKIFGNWIDRLKINVMPAGVYGVRQDELRLLEMPETKSIGLGDAFKSDDRGLWEIEFNPLVEIARSDLVMLATEIQRIQISGGIDTKASDKPMITRERTSYLNIVGAMLAQLTAGKANDTTVIQQAITDFGTKQGISERKLQEVFAAAKRSLASG